MIAPKFRNIKGQFNFERSAYLNLISSSAASNQSEENLTNAEFVDSGLACR